MRTARSTIVTAGALLLAHAAVIARFGGRPSGIVLSDLIQLAIGILCVLTSIRAFRRSGSVGRYYWRLLAATFGVWVLAQALGVYIDAASNHSLDAVDDLLFFLSGIPFGMLLFLDPDYEPNRFDRLHLLDFLQVCAFWVSVYLSFSKGPSLALTTIGWGRFGWNSSLIFNGVLVISFLLRALLTNSTIVRAFFGRMALFLFFSGLADSYVSFAPNRIQSGSWFDIIWSVLLVIPLVVAATWNQKESRVPPPETQAQRVVINQFFPLVYPFFSLLLIVQLARSDWVMASSLGTVIFVAVGVRVLIIQHRLVHLQNKLEFEATHDTLTCVFSRGAILECLEKEVVRQDRNGEPVGLIMVDVDHFKRINDTHGHMVGDEVLREIARRLAGGLRSYDFVGRYGGEEFLIVVPNCNGPDTFASAERLRQGVAALPIDTSTGPIPVTLSMGFVSTTGYGQELDCTMLLRRADGGLYSAKAKGRNRVEGAFFWGAEPVAAGDPEETLETGG